MRQFLRPFLASTVLVILVFVFFEDVEVYIEEMITVSQTNKSDYIWISGLFLSSDILLPVPSSIIMYANGLVLGTLWGTLLSLVCALISSCIGYVLGLLSAKTLGSEKREEASNILNKYGIMAIIISRGVPILSESISYTAGYMRMKFRTFFLLNVIGYLPITLLYAYFGSLGSDLNIFLYCFAASLLISLILVVLVKRNLVFNE
ncbi:MAG: VTT domain-containing protein [Crocinitomicaceae bacterium]|nr:VTT domain-containing protein [Crocinitomicaceae bacterium]